jgi:Uma2 family endonuclease
MGKIKGAPDLVIEVFSPGTEKFDKSKNRQCMQRRR